MNHLYLCTYEKYLSSQMALTLDEMDAIYTQMTQGTEQDEDAKELFQDILVQAINYMQYRANWILWDREKKTKSDEMRTMCHDSLIIKFNIFARYMKSKGYSTEWRDILGDEKANSYTRKRIGDFACYMVLIYALGAR